MLNVSDEKLKKWFATACVWETVSCALLFLVAMPIKYQFDYVLPMPFAGSFHGFWFTVYLLLLFKVRKIYKWDDEDFIIYIMYAFVPFATLAVHKVIKEDKNNQ
ncbi:DUF3817 domain-containing protein [Empedobacter stercoris]|uniref:DUF3817 domain-containing protein n=1 Tax=Empedobacter falsenii TaxID=343874 RepID=A0ABY8VBI4_9FLAO|nr:MULTISPECIES: DUF3817 domain-containing protein [Empedobacter]MCA4775779.1 DUF3817 domain-containing protein [Empedobacter stercoris]UWX68162.1 DUF3817 domain-containing protein [Empedobacter stercoris]WIH98306.1 DUF3817 domain-containing protein [Empedobacter falsenii]HJD87435.1 DUF3817 domain-containing protein [Empedobacter falsenii]